MSTVSINTNSSSIMKKPASDQWVKLNVGGQYFVTTRTTLSQDPSSFLCRLIREDCGLISDRVSNNHYFYQIFVLTGSIFIPLF